MITLTLADTELKSLDKESADKITSLLGLGDVDYSDFFSGETHDFYDFFFDVLLQKNTPCAIHTDWKWHPENIFWQLNKSNIGWDFELVTTKDDPNYLAFDVVYDYNNYEVILKVNFSEPNRLLESIEDESSYESGKQFVEINFLEDSYSWLIAPEGFDIQAFMQLTGLRLAPIKSTPPWQLRYDFRHPNLKADYGQPQKLFFLPTIIYVENDHSGYFFRYKKSGSGARVTNGHSVWAGRILAGQTAKEGIATELESELGYTGRFDYIFAGYDGTLKDRQGKDVHRYNLTLFLYDKTFADSTRGGYEIEMQKISGFNISLFQQYMY